jgi:hypothetical protein
MRWAVMVTFEADASGGADCASTARLVTNSTGTKQAIRATGARQDFIARECISV